MAAGNGFTVTTLVIRQPVGNVYVITAVPAVKPFTIPLEELIIATDVLPLHVPPVTVFVKVVAKPAQTDAVPPMAGGSGLTVKTTVDVQPDGSVYVITVVPDASPLTTPLLIPIVATVVLLLLQVPPVVLLLKVAVSPSHTLAVPVIAAGNGLTVIFLIARQVVGKVYTI
jgi:hypothetical protein